MEREKTDIAIIGAGPGGYVAAIKAAQSGLKVTLIEKGYLGGTCLNVGCIPTKTLLGGAQVLHKIKRSSEYGISTGDVSFDYSKMKVRKDGVVEKIRKSLEGLLLSNKIVILRGNAEFLSPKEIKVKGEKNSVLEADKVIIATGSVPLDIPAFPCDHERIFNSTSILELTKLPESLAIIGGGYIGCEFASLFAELGVKVTILEALPSIVSLQGKTISDALTKAFLKKGIIIETGVMVEGIDKTGSGVSIRLKDKPALTAESALVSVGRKILSDHLGIEKTAVKVGDKGAIVVNDKMETSVPGIYAIGDVTGQFLLAHVASHQGIVAAANATGQEAHMHYNAVPAVIFTEPEIATVGMTEEQAIAAGRTISVGRFPFQALGKSVATIETEGFVQVISDQKTKEILGAQAVGHEAASLIAEMALAIHNELTLEEVADTIHAHPTLPEAWMEAALIAEGTPIHFPPKLKK
jgi:dihydrolipoamide dehydrogenase